MRKEMIESYIRELASSFGGILPLIPGGKLKEMHDRRDIGKMVGFVRDSFMLDIRLRVGIVNSGGPPKAPAWTALPLLMPSYGTEALKNAFVTVYFRREFINRGKFEGLVLAIAHELSHIVLESTRHKLRKEEAAVDLTAMILGYRRFFLIGCRHSEVKVVERDDIFGRILGIKESIETTYRLGYLEFDEVVFATDMIERMSTR